MSLIKELIEKPANSSTASKYTGLNGVLYLGTGALFIAWPGGVQAIFMDSAFVGHEAALFSAIGLTLLTLAIHGPSLAIGAWVLLRRKT